MTQRDRDIALFVIAMIKHNNDGRHISSILRDRVSREDRQKCQKMVANFLAKP